MNARDEQIRALIADQAGDWFVAHRSGTLGAGERKAFDEWLLVSPLHVEEYLGVARIASVLPTAADDPDHPFEAILARVRDEHRSNVSTLGTATAARHLDTAGEHRAPRWRLAAVATSLIVIVASTLVWWRFDYVAPLRYVTRHGEFQTWRLADNSVLRLDTDTAVIVRYSRGARRVEIEHGRAFFEVAHESARPFRVTAGAASVTAVGTKFDVYRESDSTVVTVVEGQVSVSLVAEVAGPAMREGLRVSGGEQVRVAAGVLPGRPSPTDTERSTAWLRRQIVFERQPLASVAAEFNRYGAVPIEIETPGLRALLISGLFAADDPDTFIAFLRGLEGVTVDATPARIRVLARPTAAPGDSWDAR